MPDPGVAHPSEDGGARPRGAQRVIIDANGKQKRNGECESAAESI